jgi:hypothetical protein
MSTECIKKLSHIKQLLTGPTEFPEVAVSSIPARSPFFVIMTIILRIPLSQIRRPGNAAKSCKTGYESRAEASTNNSGVPQGPRHKYTTTSARRALLINERGERQGEERNRMYS